MMRWRLFAIWAAITVTIIAIILSEFFFGKAEVKKLGIRLALALIWPLAALSRSGSELLFKQGKEL